MEQLAFKTYRFLERWKRGIISFCYGWVISRLVNEASVPSQSISGMFTSVFSVNGNPSNVLSWIFLGLAIGTWLTSRYLRDYFKNRQYDKIIAESVRRLRSPELTPFDSFAIDHSLTLAICPELHRGWKVSEIQLHHDTTSFSLPKKYKERYEEYKNRHFEKKRLFDDGIKIMFTRNPRVGTDSKTLVLHTQETSYSIVQFYRDNVAVNISERDRLIHAAVETELKFPHSVGAHIVVVTNDSKVLLTKRSQKVAYYPGTWSCSLEEQLSQADLQKGANTVMLDLIARALLEELGLGAEKYNKDNLRILSVFLESDILNVSVCGHVVLDMSSTELDNRLHGLPRADYEFHEWIFISHDELLKEIFEPERIYHPTSRYRMIMALLRQSGEPQIAKALQRMGTYYHVKS